MKTDRFQSKSNRVLSFILDEITSGRLTPGSRLASVRELARQFSVSNKVVEGAIGALERERLIVRKPRSGIYITGQSRKGKPTVALFSHTKGRFYEHQTCHMVTEFQKKSHLTIVIDIDEFIGDKSQQEEIFMDILDRKLDGLVIDGLSGFPIHLLIKYMDRLPRLAFFNRFEFNHTFEALYVLSETFGSAMKKIKHSSVSFQEELIADTVVSKMTSLKFLPEKIYIKPKVMSTDQRLPIS